VALNLALISRFGTIGAALAATFSYLIATGVLLLAFIAESGLALRDVTLVRLSDLVFRASKSPVPGP